MHLGGSTLTSPALIFRCSSKAADRAKRIVDFIKDSLEEDAKNRENGEVKGFSDCIRLSRIPSKAQKEEIVERMEEDSDVILINGSSSTAEESKSEIIKLDQNTVTSRTDFEKFGIHESSSSEDSSEPEQKIAKLEIQPKKKSKSKKPKVSQRMEDSEDEETVVLTSLDP